MGKERLELGRDPKRRPQLRKAQTRFTLARQETFFATLAAGCNVTRACRAARISRDCVYKWRIKSAAFRARWAEAVREGYARLELMMLERALNGTVRTLIRADGSKETVHDYPNAIALQLLRLHRQSATEAGIEHEPEDIETVRDRIARKIERLRKRDCG